MEVMPVIDIMGGKAVSGRSGKREEYSPLYTVFADSHDPVDIASRIPYPIIYVADLDGIMKGVPDISLLKRLALSKALMVDAGVRKVEDLSWFYGIEADIVLGTETLLGPDVILKALEDLGKRVVVSVDIKDGHVMSTFLPVEPHDALDHLIRLGAKRFIFLDITSVGTMGFGTLEPLISYAKSNYPKIEILVGGGIKKEDIKEIKKMGVEGVLIGTALHNGLI